MLRTMWILSLMYIPLAAEQYPTMALWESLKNVSAKTNKQFVIIVPSYNNELWYKKNLDSIFAQTYPHYRVVYCNDVSTDNTLALVQDYVRACKQEHRVEIVHRTTNVGGLANMYLESHRCNNSDIVLEVDGDDWLAHPHVLELLNKVYDNPSVWFTYSQYQEYPSLEIGHVRPLAEHYIKNNNYRHSSGWLSHLHTYYAWLFKLIKKEDLCDAHGNFLKLSWDHAMMWPMAEMAAGRMLFIPDVLYIYNKANPINDFRIRQAQQLEVARMLCRKPRYAPLPEHYVPNQ